MTATKRPRLTGADFEQISEMIYRHCGIHLHDGKRELVETRIARRMRAGGFGSLQEYLDSLAADSTGREFTLLIDAMSTNLTSFNRESSHFEFVVKTALPELLARKQKTGDQRIRMWSAACSTGEEPYTLAMYLLNAIPNMRRWDLKILATDISTHVLQVARFGFYSGERIRPLPMGFGQRFFSPSSLDGERGFSVAQEVRDLVSFRNLNLVHNWPFTGPFDLIFCRNVMIYFDQPTQERLVQRFWECLLPGGYLFTGHAESLNGMSHRFRFVEPTVYQK